MIVLDPCSVSIVTGAVVTVTALTYVVGSVVRRDGGGARLWALAYLLVLVAAVARSVDVVAAEPASHVEWAAGLGNAATVGAAGCFLLGCRAFNGAAVEGPAFMVGAVALLTGAATVADEAVDSQHFGSIWLFLALGGMFVGVVVHAFRGRMRTTRTSWAFAAAAAVQAAFSLACGTLILAGWGTSDPVLAWFGSTAYALVAVTAGLVMMICTFILREELSDGARVATMSEDDEVLTPAAFRAHLENVLRRATERMEVVAVIAVRVEDSPAIGIAFGSEVVHEITRSLRDSVRRFAAPLALVGDGDVPTSMFVATQSASPADARRQAGLIYRGVVQAFVGEGGVIVPGMGVGVALSQTVGYDATVLCAAALAASAEAVASEESSVVFAPAQGFAPDSTLRESA